MTARSTGQRDARTESTAIDRVPSRTSARSQSLRQRVKPPSTPSGSPSGSSSAASSSSKSEADTPPSLNDSTTDMFASRKYQALPTSNNGAGGPRRRGPSPLRKYVIFGGLAVFACVVLLGGRHVATTSSSLTQTGKESMVVGGEVDDSALESIWGELL